MSEGTEDVSKAEESGSELSDPEVLGFDPEGGSGDEPDIVEETVRERQGSKDGDTPKESSTSVTVDDESTVEDKGEEPEEVGGSESAQERFKFLGREYENQGAAEHAMSSYLGQVSAWEKKNDELATQYGELADRYEELVSRLSSETSSGAEVGTDPTDKQTDGAASAARQETPLSKEIWTQFRRLYDSEEYGPQVAQYWLQSEYQKHTERLVNEGVEQLRTEWNQFREPFDQEKDADAEYQVAFDAFSNLGKRVDEKTGELLYPEVNEEKGDPDFVERVGTRWRKLPREARDADPVYAAWLSYLAEKEWQSRQSPEATVPGGAAESASRNAKGQFTKASPAKELEEFNAKRREQEKASVLDDEGSIPSRPAKGNLKESLEHELLSEDGIIDPVLGF